MAWTWVKANRGHSSAQKQCALLAHVHGLVPASASVEIAGDGEFAFTAIEAPMHASLRFHLRKDIAVEGLQFVTHTSLTRADSRGYHYTTTYGEDLCTNAQNAVQYMVDGLVGTGHFSRSQAYGLCSVAGEVKISLIVTNEKEVPFYVPLSIFYE